jgi:D-tyrosyl-tRNA(Tyr) deacylase
MNHSVEESNGSILVVSQFTLLGDCRKGRRPGFTDAAAPELADTLYEDYVRVLRSRGMTVVTGVFRADMQVALINDGPVTIMLDSRKQF